MVTAIFDLAKFSYLQKRPLDLICLEANFKVNNLAEWLGKTNQ